MKLARPLLLSPEQGARTSIYLSTAPEVAGVSGQYFARCKPQNVSKAARNDDAARRLWQVSEDLTGFTYPDPATGAAAAVAEPQPNRLR